MKNHGYKLSRGVKTFIRRQKAFLRKKVTDLEVRKQEIEKLYESYKKELSKKSKS